MRWNHINTSQLSHQIRDTHTHTVRYRSFYPPIHGRHSERFVRVFGIHYLRHDVHGARRVRPWHWAVHEQNSVTLAMTSYGCRCVGGDTDSVFVQFPTSPSLLSRDDIMGSIYQQARELELFASGMFPPPNKLEFETVKSPCLLSSKKKTYACLEYPCETNDQRICVDQTR